MGSELKVLEGAPHGCNVSHADQWNSAVLDFLGEWRPEQAAQPAAAGAATH